MRKHKTPRRVVMPDGRTGYEHCGEFYPFSTMMQQRFAYLAAVALSPHTPEWLHETNGQFRCLDCKRTYAYKAGDAMSRRLVLDSLIFFHERQHIEDEHERKS